MSRRVLVRASAMALALVAIVAWVCVGVVDGGLLPASSSLQSLDHRTVFHLFPTSLASPINAASALAHMHGHANAGHSQEHAGGHGVNARASSAVRVMTFAKEFDSTSDEDRPAILAVPSAVHLAELSPEWSAHPQLNRLVQLQCGLSLMAYCTDGPEEGQDALAWAHVKLDRPCVLPIVRRSTVVTAAAADGASASITQISGVAVLLFIPPHSTSHPSPSHAHAAHSAHHGLPPAGSTRHWAQCQMSLANEFEREAEEEEHAEWLDPSTGRPTDEVRFFSDFTTDSAPSAASAVWTGSDIPAYMAEVYRQFQVASTGRQAVPVAPHEESDFFDGITRVVESAGSSGDPAPPNSTDDGFGSETVFLETRTSVDVLDRASVMSEIHAREMADTNDLYRLMGQLTDATRTGASATVVWELVIRPCVNILRKQLLEALKQLMAKTLIKGLHSLVTSAINPNSPPPEASTYTKPPVAVVEDPEQLWSSLPAVIPDAVVPPPEMGTELAQLQVDDSVFLQVENVHAVSGILDPLLEFAVPVLHNIVTQATHDIAQKGMAKSIDMHSIGPMKAQIHAGVHRKAVEMLTEQLTTQVTEAVTKDLIAHLPRTITLLGTQDIHKALARPLTMSLVQGLTFSLTRSHLQDEECEAGKPACDVTKANDYYVNFYADYYARYFERFYTFYYTEWYAKLFANDQLKKA